MWLNGEISDHEKEEREESGNFQPQKLAVGYALTSKKKKRFLQPKLEVLARNKGIIFVAIDLNRPLSDQGPFDVVLHKMSGTEWSEIIERLAHLIMGDDQIVEISPSRIQTNAKLQFLHHLPSCMAAVYSQLYHWFLLQDMLHWH